MSSGNSDPLLTAFGSAIRVVRLRSGLSQEALADRADLDRTYVSGVERGVRNPSLLTLKRIATALDTPLHELLAISEERRSQDG